MAARSFLKGFSPLRGRLVRNFPTYRPIGPTRPFSQFGPSFFPRLARSKINKSRAFIMSSTAVIGAIGSSSSLSDFFESNPPNETKIIDIDPNKIKDGKHIVKMPDGCWIETHYLDEKKNGPEKIYRKNGTIVGSLNYENGIPTGYCCYYNESGKVQLSAEFYYGKLNGITRFFDSDDNMVAMPFLNDQPLLELTLCFDKNGQILKEHAYNFIDFVSLTEQFSPYVNMSMNVLPKLYSTISTSETTGLTTEKISHRESSNIIMRELWEYPKTDKGKLVGYHANGKVAYEATVADKEIETVRVMYDETGKVILPKFNEWWKSRPPTPEAINEWFEKSRSGTPEK